MLKLKFTNYGVGCASCYVVWLLAICNKLKNTLVTNNQCGKISVGTSSPEEGKSKSVVLVPMPMSVNNVIVLGTISDVYTTKSQNSRSAALTSSTNKEYLRLSK